jgi:membrane associated rhomboid family serine protease
MKRFRSWFASIPPGTRWLLATPVVLLAADVLVGMLGRGGLSHLLGLTPSGFRGGFIWQGFTYWLLPAGLIDLLVSGVVLVLLAPRLERDWSAGQIVGYCAIAATGAGLCHVLVAGSGQMLLGLRGVVIGLLAAWAKMYGAEPMAIPGLGPVSTRGLMLGAALIAAGVAGLASPGGWRDALVLFGGGATGWSYLALRWRWNRSRPGTVTACTRTRRLEL